MRGGTSTCKCEIIRQNNFNPPAPCGAGPGYDYDAVQDRVFQSTRPMRGGTMRRRYWAHLLAPFQSTRPMRGGTTLSPFLRFRSFDFNPPAPCGAGLWPYHRKIACCDFNPPAPCGAGRRLTSSTKAATPISIHPPHAGRDLAPVMADCRNAISIHPPHAGRDGGEYWTRIWGAISIHPPHAGRDVVSIYLRPHHRISIHPPHAGRDTGCPEMGAAGQQFQSTRPMRGGTAIMHKIYPMHSCTIHNTTCS